MVAGLAGSKTHSPGGVLLPASASRALTAPPYLAAPSPLGTANCHTQGKSTQPRPLRYNRDEPAGQDRTAQGIMSPAQGGKHGFQCQQKDHSKSPRMLASPLVFSVRFKGSGQTCSSAESSLPYRRKRPCDQRSACLLPHLTQQTGIAGSFCVLDPEATVRSKSPLVHNKGWAVGRDGWVDLQSVNTHVW